MERVHCTNLMMRYMYMNSLYMDFNGHFNDLHAETEGPRGTRDHGNQSNSGHRNSSSFNRKSNLRSVDGKLTLSWLTSCLHMNHNIHIDSFRTGADLSVCATEKSRYSVRVFQILAAGLRHLRCDSF